MRDAFHAAHRERFGFGAQGALVVELLRVEAIARADQVDVTFPLPAATKPSIGHVATEMAGRPRRPPLHRRDELAPGAEVPGPALIVDPISTTVVEPGWTARVHGEGSLVLTRHAPRVTEGAG